MTSMLDWPAELEEVRIHGHHWAFGSRMYSWLEEVATQT